MKLENLNASYNRIKSINLVTNRADFDNRWTHICVQESYKLNDFRKKVYKQYNVPRGTWKVAPLNGRDRVQMERYCVGIRACKKFIHRIHVDAKRLQDIGVQIVHLVGPKEKESEFDIYMRELIRDGDREEEARRQAIIRGEEPINMISKEDQAWLDSH
jgi:hypothetical protein